MIISRARSKGARGAGALDTELALAKARYAECHSCAALAICLRHNVARSVFLAHKKPVLIAELRQFGGGLPQLRHFAYSSITYAMD